MNAAVLLAEPEPSTREFLQRHLADDGFDVLGAEAEREALELAERLRPSLVLSSPELCRRLREGEPGRSWDREVPVIVLGGTEADTVDRVRAFDRGCDDYVPRPFHYDELLARIRAVLRRTSPSLRERVEAGPIAVDLVTRRATVHGRAVTLPAKETTCLRSSRPSPSASSPRSNCCARSGAISRSVVRALWTRTPRGFAASCGRPEPAPVWSTSGASATGCSVSEPRVS